MRVHVLGILWIILAVTPVLAHADLPCADRDLTPSAMGLLDQAQEEVLRLHFGHALTLCAQAESMAADHPLPLAVDVGVRLYEIQEIIIAGAKNPVAFQEFYIKDAALVKMASMREKSYPESPYPKMQLGMAYGCRGLVNLYEKNYFASYHDGKRGANYLQQAVDIDPSQYNAYIGLGQFKYYCARLNGLLQFLLDLQGNEKEGIRELELCESKGTYSVLPSRALLASILIYDQRDWKDAYPLLEKLYDQFPHNYHHVRMAVTFAEGNGMDKTESRRFMKRVCQQWDQGWRPPSYVKSFPLEAARLDLARYYMKSGEAQKARRHLMALSQSSDASIAKTAQSLLRSLP